MRFCKPHWDKLKSGIIAAGGSDFIAKDGVEAVKQMQAELEGKPKTRDNYDPLMAAHWMIVHNATRMLQKIGVNPLCLLTDPPLEHPEWSCPICYLNWLSLEHDRTCVEPDCKKTKGQTMDHWIDCAVRDAMAAIPKE